MMAPPCGARGEERRLGKSGREALGIGTIGVLDRKPPHGVEVAAPARREGARA